MCPPAHIITKYPRLKRVKPSNFFLHEFLKGLVKFSAAAGKTYIKIVEFFDENGGIWGNSDRLSYSHRQI